MSTFDLSQDLKNQPQNPYGSFLVAASAGSGKTYQLSKRFLRLVAAGAPPSSILTVTFTKKAAAEMRARILHEAALLLHDEASGLEFDRTNGDYFRHHRQQGSSYNSLHPLKAPLVGRRILEQSQLLPIATIDSLLTQWVSKFPLEASPSGTFRGKPWEGGVARDFPSPYQLLDPLDRRIYDEQGWWATCQFLTRLRAGAETQADLDHPLRRLLGLPVAGVRLNHVFQNWNRLEALIDQSSLIWYLEQIQGSAFRTLASPSSVIDHDALWRGLTEPLQRVAQKLSNPDLKAKVLEAVRAQNFDSLLATGLITQKTYTVSGSYIRSANRLLLGTEIAVIDHLCKLWVNQKRLEVLDQSGHALYHLYRLFREARDTLKFQSGHLEFSDLAQGGFRLFYGDTSAGVRYLFAQTIHHVMLDEFQDTSRLQWAIFRELAQSILSTPELVREGPPPSLFIVGDQKQSIYGFREADPRVMDDAAQDFQDHLKVTPLSTSYRTTPLVLEFLNNVFGQSLGGSPKAAPLITGFPAHRAATSPDGHLLTPEAGGILIADLVTDDQKQKPSQTPEISRIIESSGQDPEVSAPLQTEAKLVAEILHRILNHPGDLPEDPFHCPVYDSDLKVYRPIRPSDCVLLYRSATHGDLYGQALRERGISSHKAEEKGFFKRREILDAVALLQVCFSWENREAFATVLKSPLGLSLKPNLDDQKVLQCLWKSSQSAAGLRGQALWDQVQDFCPKFARLLKLLKQKAALCLPHELLDAGLKELGASEAYGRSTEDRDLAGGNLLKLVEIVIGLESQGLLDLVSVLTKLDQMAKDDPLGLASVTRDSVTMMTIHKSKGLEFPLVFLVDGARPWGQRESYWESTPEEDGLCYIGTSSDYPVQDPGFEALRQASDAKTAAECWRLLYVALTRAKQYLVVTGHQPKQTRGLKETTVYFPLRDSLSRLGPPKEIQIGDELLTVTYHRTVGPAHQPMDALRLRELKALRDEERWSKKAITGNATTPTHATLLPRGVRIQSPSRHQEAAQEELLDLFRSQDAPVVTGIESHQKSPTIDVRGCPRLAKAAGTWVHKGLQYFMEGKRFDGNLHWQVLAPDEYRSFHSIQDYQQDLLATVQDPWLLQLLETSLYKSSEKPLVFIRGRNIFSCVLDLFLIDAQGQPLIVDYKTTRFYNSRISGQDLLTFCHERGWDEQLRDYSQGMVALFKEEPTWWDSLGLASHEPQMLVYFTSLRRAVSLV